MQVDIIAAGELDEGLDAAWRGFQAAGPDLKSPFYAPDFVRIVGEVRDDVRIAVISDEAGVAGFFPYHKMRGGRLAPLAGEISDYQGIIGRSDAVDDVRALLRALKAQVYDFNHVPVSQERFSSHAFLRANSPYVTLADGYEAWYDAQRGDSKDIRSLDRKTRKLAREGGELRFVANDRDPVVWEKLMDWRRATLAAMGVKFILDQPWAGAVVDRIRETDMPGFGGMTSALWAGEELAAVSFSMRTDRVGHSWFPAYNRDYSRTSPGLILLLDTLRHCAESGLVEYDLGRGPEQYKTEFANGARALCEGSVERRATPLGLTRQLRKAAQAAAQRFGSPETAEFTRRAGNRLLSAGRLS